MSDAFALMVAAGLALTMVVLVMQGVAHAGQQPRKPYQINTNQEHTTRRVLTPEERDALVAQAHRDLAIGDANQALTQRIRAELANDPFAEVDDVRARIAGRLGKGS